MIKLKDRDLYSKNVAIISRLILSFIWKKRQKEYAHLLRVSLLFGSDIQDAAHSLSFGVLPDIFVIISAVGADGRCISRCQVCTQLRLHAHKFNNGE